MNFCCRTRTIPLSHAPNYCNAADILPADIRMITGTKLRVSVEACVGLAEDLAQEALMAALEKWPSSGIQPNPGAWLMATAKHRVIVRQSYPTSRTSAATVFHERGK
jgi:predicted RNA polymerase sigma factor